MYDTAELLCSLSYDLKQDKAEDLYMQQVCSNSPGGNLRYWSNSSQACSLKLRGGGWESITKFSYSGLATAKPHLRGLVETFEVTGVPCWSLCPAFRG